MRSLLSVLVFCASGCLAVEDAGSELEAPAVPEAPAALEPAAKESPPALIPPPPPCDIGVFDFNASCRIGVAVVGTCADGRKLYKRVRYKLVYYTNGRVLTNTVYETVNECSATRNDPYCSSICYSDIDPDV